MTFGVALRGLGHRLLAYAPLLGVLVFCALNAAQANAAAGINQQINFQGRLLNASGATVPDGFYNIQFKIYQDGDGQSVGNTTGSPSGSLLWTENHLVSTSSSVQVKNGFMSVQLGSVNPFGSSIDWNQDTLWLSMNIGDTTSCSPFSSCSPDGEMVPMKRLSSTPYALNAGMLGGLTSAQFLQLAPGTAQTDATTNSSININKTSTGNFITLQASADTAFAITNAGDLFFGNNANHTLTVEAASSGVAGKSLGITAGDAGSGGSAQAGGDLLLSAGNAAGTGDADGGDILLQAGNDIGSGETGRVIIKAGTGIESGQPYFSVQNNSSMNILGASAVSNEVYMFGTPVNNSYKLTFANDIYGSTCFNCAITVGNEDSSTGEGDGMDLHFFAGNTSDTGADGGEIVLTAGQSTGGGSNGGVTVKNAGTSTEAFSVKTPGGAITFNVDDSNNIVSLGEGLTLPVPNFNNPTLTTTGGSIANGTTYYYAITASDGTNTTEHSPVISYTVVSGTNTNKINLSWSQSIGATSYKIYRNTTNNFTSGSLLLTTIGSGATTTYSDTGSATGAGLPPATVYDPTLFRVDAAATNPFGDGQVADLGSMYYNTTSGEFQCYKDAGVGGTWTDCGVTTLQGAYNNSTNSLTTPAVKLDSTHSTLNIQDADTTIAADILDIRGSNGVGLGSVLFGVGNTGQVTMQNSSDQVSAVRVLSSGGTYLVNTNSSSGYFITNTTRQLANEVINPSFEAGGNLTSGEEGWNGPAQGTITNNSSNANTGNYELQVTPNSTTLKFYAGTYYTVQSGDVVSFEAWVKTGGSANGTGGIIIEGYDKDKAFVGSASDAASLPGTSYGLKGTTYTVPSNVAYVRVAGIVNSGATTGSYYFDDAYLTSTKRGQQLFQNSADSTTAFRIRSAGAGQTLFTADTTNNKIKVGDDTGTDGNTTLFQLDSSATWSTTTGLTGKNGGLYYDSTSNGLKAIISGTVVDICTTAVTCTGYSGSAGTTVQLQATSPGTAQTGHFNITGTGILTQLQTEDKSSASTNTSNLTVRTGNATGSTSNSGSLTLDVGTATGTLGTITIGHASVSTTMPGSLDIQGSSSLKLGTSSSAAGSILFRNAAGSNTITLQAPGSNPTSSWTMTLPQNPGSAGQCLKDSSGTGDLAFGSCDPGSAISLQDAYTNSSSPATITLANSKDLKIVAQDTTTDPNFLVDLQCDTSCSTNGRFAVQDDGTDIFTVQASTSTIVLAVDTQIGSGTTDATQINFHLDSYNGSSDTGTCSTTVNQGAMYYNTTMGSLRGCINGSWGDVTNPDTLGLLTFGIIPSSGSNPYDLPALVTAGVSGPCKVSWNSATSVHVEACTAYSRGRRVNVTAVNLNTNSATTDNTNLTTTNRWGHVCLTGASDQPAFTNTAGQNTALTAMPTFSVSSPILCLADVQGSNSSGGTIDNIYDVRTFTSTIKEAVNTTTASELGQLVDAASGGLVPAATCTTGTCSGKLYGVIIVTDGSTSTTTPNSIVASVGPSYIKATAGTAGQFIKSGPTAGYGETVTSIPNNAFYYSPGNTRTTWSTTCSAANNCLGSLYVNFIVR